MEIPEVIIQEIEGFTGSPKERQMIKSVIRKAILVERQRCAEIAKRFGRNLIARHILEIKYKDIAPAPARLPDDGE